MLTYYNGGRQGLMDRALFFVLKPKKGGMASIGNHYHHQVFYQEAIKGYYKENGGLVKMSAEVQSMFYVRGTTCWLAMRITLYKQRKEGTGWERMHCVPSFI